MYQISGFSFPLLKLLYQISGFSFSFLKKAVLPLNCCFSTMLIGFLTWLTSCYERIRRVTVLKYGCLSCAVPRVFRVFESCDLLPLCFCAYCVSDCSLIIINCSTDVLCLPFLRYSLCKSSTTMRVSFVRVSKCLVQYARGESLLQNS